MYLWNPSYSVGQRDIDLEHQQFIDKINQFELAGKEGKSTEKVGEILQFLVNYAQHHFQNEEQYMADNEFPKLTEHTRSHMSFVSQMVAFQNQLRSTGSTPELASKISTFCGDWLINHIMTADLQYTRWVKERKNLSE